MKKILSLILVIAMLAVMFVGCTSQEDPANNDVPVEQNPAEEAPVDEAPAEDSASEEFVVGIC